jgi:hypothetical protein
MLVVYVNAVYMVALFTGRRCADNVHVTGCASISGKKMAPQ